LAKSDLDRALADFNEAVGLDPQAAYIRRNRAHVWLCKGEYDRAIADYTEAIRLQPDVANAHLDRAFTRLLQRRHDAIDGFQAFIDMDEKPETSTGAIWGTVAARLLKDENAARRFLTKSLAKSDDDWPSPLFRLLFGPHDHCAFLEFEQAPFEHFHMHEDIAQLHPAVEMPKQRQGGAKKQRPSESQQREAGGVAALRSEPEREVNQAAGPEQEQHHEQHKNCCMKSPHPAVLAVQLLQHGVHLSLVAGALLGIARLLNEQSPAQVIFRWFHNHLV
jgi:tetratricopeptide (TPR) repeat protein